MKYFFVRFAEHFSISFMNRKFMRLGKNYIYTSRETFAHIVREIFFRYFKDQN